MNEHKGLDTAEQISLYALGALEANERAAFEAHLADGCLPCAAELRSFDSVIAALGDVAEVTPPPTVRHRLVGFLKDEQAKAASRTSPPAAVAEILKIRSSQGDWKQLGPGLFRKVLFVDTERGTVTSLLKLEAGARIPEHPHGGIEECILLEGDVHSDTESFSSGDYMCAPAGSIHPMLYSQNGALMFIVSAQ